MGRAEAIERMGRAGQAVSCVRDNGGRFEEVLLARVNATDSHALEAYRADGGYEAARKAITEMAPEEVTEEVSSSGLRGRGGAGFPTGRKWQFVPDVDGPKYLAVNADESEPGTFKDRVLIEADPHALLEACLITGWAVGIETSYIYIRGEMALGAERLEGAIAEAREAGLLGEGIFGTDFAHDIHVHRGAGAYICGEESALLTSLEGNRGYPRIRPPFPAVKGAFSRPTVVNNVETLVNLPLIIERGAEWFASIGPEKSTGPKLFCISGHVERPGLYEVPMGLPLSEMVEMAGGVWKDRAVKAVIPGGSSVPCLGADRMDVRMDFESLDEAGSLLGSAGVMVLDETTCMVDALWNVLRFYAHESCGQCTPCREGCGWLARICGRLERGEGRPDDVELMLDVANNMTGRTICALADAAQMPTVSYVETFRDEFDAHLEEGRCPVGAGTAAAATSGGTR